MKKVYMGKNKYGIECFAHTISNGDLSITVLDYGATLQRFVHKGTDIILGYETLADIENGNGNHGAVIGRYANRISGGRLILDGVCYPIVRNNGEAHLHGGKVGFGSHTWNVEDGLLPDGTPTLSCGYNSPDGEEGYPGFLISTVTYILKKTELIIEYRATTTRPTYCNLTNHAYFNLHGCGDTTVLDHKLTVNADYYTEVDPRTLLPTGARPSVEGTAFDFRQEKTVGADIDKTGLPYPGYDHNFLVNHTSPSVCKNSGGSGPFFEMIARGEVYAGLEMNPAVICRTPERELTVLTSMPGVQIYTGNFLGEGPAFKGGVKPRKHQGICFETQYEPDSPSRGEARLDPGEFYHHATIFRLK